MLFLLPGTLLSSPSWARCPCRPQFSSPLPRAPCSDSTPRLVSVMRCGICDCTHLVGCQLSVCVPVSPSRQRALCGGQALCPGDLCTPAPRTMLGTLGPHCRNAGWMDGRTEGWLERRVDECMGGWIDGTMGKVDWVSSRVFSRQEAGSHDCCGPSPFHEEFLHQSCWRRGRRPHLMLTNLPNSITQSGPLGSSLTEGVLQVWGGRGCEAQSQLRLCDSW